MKTLLAALLLTCLFVVPREVLAQDRDNDGLSDDDEAAEGTNPDDPDTDQGGESDGDEFDAGRNPLDDSDDVVGGTEPHFITGGQDCSTARVPWGPGSAGVLIPMAMLVVPVLRRRRRRRAIL